MLPAADLKDLLDPKQKKTCREPEKKTQRMHNCKNKTKACVKMFDGFESTVGPAAHVTREIAQESYEKQSEYVEPEDAGPLKAEVAEKGLHVNWSYKDL